MNRRTLLTLALLTALLAAGCLGVRPQPGIDDTRPLAGRTLTILDQGAFPQYALVRSTFETQTGATLRVIDGGDAGGALRTALLGAGNPPADILFGVDNALFFTPAVRQQNLFVPYESPHLNLLDTPIIDTDVFRVDGQLWATPVEHGYVSVNYDARLLTSTPANQLPVALRDLATARWAGTFVTEDPRFSSPGLGFLLITIATFPEGSPYDWKAYWKDLLRNGTKVARDWSEAYVYHYSGGYGASDPQNAGDRKIVVSYTTSPAAEVMWGREYGTTTPPGISLEPEGGVFHQVETMGILRGSQNVELAKAFIDFMLKPEFQSLNAPHNAVYPVTRGIALPDDIRDLATPPTFLKPAQLSPSMLRANLEAWVRTWETLYQAETA